MYLISNVFVTSLEENVLLIYYSYVSSLNSTKKNSPLFTFHALVDIHIDIYNRIICWKPRQVVWWVFSMYIFRLANYISSTNESASNRNVRNAEKSEFRTHSHVRIKLNNRKYLVVDRSYQIKIYTLNT